MNDALGKQDEAWMWQVQGLLWKYLGFGKSGCRFSYSDLY